jgi:hypothetical protein
MRGSPQYLAQRDPGHERDVVRVRDHHQPARLLQAREVLGIPAEVGVCDARPHAPRMTHCGRRRIQRHAQKHRRIGARQSYSGLHNHILSRT